MQSRQIGEYSVSVSMLPAFTAVEHLTTLTSLIGPPLAGLLASKEDDGKLASALAASLRGLKGSDVSSLMRGLLATVSITKDGKTFPLLPVFDVEMQGKLVTAFRIVAFAIEVNYADFFGGARSAFAGLGDKLKSRLATAISEPSA